MPKDMKTSEFLKRMDLPKRYFGNNVVLSERFDNKKSKFLEIYDAVNGCELSPENASRLKSELARIKVTIDSNFSLISSVFEFLENVEMGAAQNTFDKLMSQIMDDAFVCDINDNISIDSNRKNPYISFRRNTRECFYRVRNVESQNELNNHNRNELFHLPISKREYANSGRFSLPGYPSLYLSSMLPLAWKESGYPRNYYYSDFKLKPLPTESENTDLWFIGLYSLQEINHWGLTIINNDFDLWLRVFSRYLKTYPLTLACSFVNDRGGAPFKQEYIIPQMLMQWTVRNIKTVNGIAYFTCTKPDSTTDDYWNAYNVAIPATKPFDDDGYSHLLTTRFDWSNPIFYSSAFLDVRKNEEYRKQVHSFINEINNCFAMYKVHPQIFYEYFMKMLRVSIYFQSFLCNSESASQILLLNMSKSILDNFREITDITQETIIDKAAEAITTGDYCDNLEKSENVFKKIYSDFQSLGVIMQESNFSLWNIFM